jgi:hypothetical protein
MVLLLFPGLPPGCDSWGLYAGIINGGGGSLLQASGAPASSSSTVTRTSPKPTKVHAQRIYPRLSEESAAGPTASRGPGSLSRRRLDRLRGASQAFLAVRVWNFGRQYSRLSEAPGSEPAAGRHARFSCPSESEASAGRGSGLASAILRRSLYQWLQVARQLGLAGAFLGVCWTNALSG